MHENGFLLSDSQQTITPIQRYIYLRAKEYHEDEAEQHAKKNSDLKDGHAATKGF